MNSRYLTKSRFLLAIECPTKLYYNARPDEYQSNKTEDAFLQALAKAGYQVGELAKCYYRDLNPCDLSDLSDNDKLERTAELLTKNEVVIFEAAIAHGNMFVRADILVKDGERLKIIEVKSSSWDAHKGSLFKQRKEKYLYDVAFQKFVLEKAYPLLSVSAYLGLMDKAAICPTQGLNQKFRIAHGSDPSVVIKKSVSLTAEDISTKLIIELNVDSEIRCINELKVFKGNMSFVECINFFAAALTEDRKIRPILGKICADCEFRVPAVKLEPGKRSGFEECWRDIAGFRDEDFNRQSVLDLWYFSGKDKLIENGKYFLEQLEEDDIAPKKKPKSKWAGLSTNARQLLQIQKAKQGSTSEYIDKDALKVEISNWKYPLHFIDFETAAPAIPLDKGAHPYHGFAFQFSHHILKEDGTIEHADQFLNTEIGVNPNVAFIRALRSSLSKDNGTIFRYHNHENTYLNNILEELITQDNLLDDKDELIQFIQSIAKPKGDSNHKWDVGDRCMVDLCKLVELYTFDPLINGKSSIKKVLPSVLNQSRYLQEKYCHRVYGKNAKIKSLNFEEPMAWVVKNGDHIVDPYSLLPKLYENLAVSSEEIELLFDEEELREGGSASIAYMYMQFSEMSEHERQSLRNGLLRYCELDTLAMVMIVEDWRNAI